MKEIKNIGSSSKMNSVIPTDNPKNSSVQDRFYQERKMLKRNHQRKSFDYFKTKSKSINPSNRSNHHNYFTMYSNVNSRSHTKDETETVENNGNSEIDDDFDALKPPPLIRLRKIEKKKSIMFFCPAKYHAIPVMQQIEEERQRGYIPYFPEIVEGQFDDADEEAVTDSAQKP